MGGPTPLPCSGEIDDVRALRRLSPCRTPRFELASQLPNDRPLTGGGRLRERFGKSRLDDVAGIFPPHCPLAVGFYFRCVT